MKQGQTLCWCVWCGTELVAGGYCYCLDIGCLCPACLPEYARVVFRSCLSKGTTFHTVRRKQKAGKHNMRCSFPLFFCPRIYILYFFAFEMHTPNL